MGKSYGLSTNVVRPKTQKRFVYICGMVQNDEHRAEIKRQNEH